jgi:hypothetical protein
MSNALAIAGVTAILRDLLDSGVIDHEVTDALGQGVAVTALAPDSIPLDGAAAKPQINLFLHQVTHNPALRNLDLPSRGPDGRRVSNAPLALDLHYLVTAYGTVDLQAEILLGYAMQLLHETPLPSREAIRKALRPPGAPVDGASLPSAYEALRASDLAEQLEQLKISPVQMNADEMSKIWTALQARYRPTAAYHVSVVLIQAQRPSRAPLPVLSRGKPVPTQVDPLVLREGGVLVRTDLMPSSPTLESITLPESRLAAHLGDAIVLSGHSLEGTGHALLLTSPRLGVEHSISPASASSAREVGFDLPVSTTVLPAGVYLAAVQVVRPTESAPRTSSQLSLRIAPEFTSAAVPLAALVRDVNDKVVVTLGCRPRVLPNQKASLLLGGREIAANPRTAPADSLTFEIDDAPIGNHLVRLRVDGVDSHLVDRMKTPPEFLDRRIDIT